MIFLNWEVHFTLPQKNASLVDPTIVIGGSVSGSIIHIIGSMLFMKRVKTKLERQEATILQQGLDEWNTPTFRESYTWLKYYRLHGNRDISLCSAGNVERLH